MSAFPLWKWWVCARSTPGLYNKGRVNGLGVPWNSLPHGWVLRVGFRWHGLLLSFLSKSAFLGPVSPNKSGLPNKTSCYFYPWSSVGTFLPPHPHPSSSSSKHTAPAWIQPRWKGYPAGTYTPSSLAKQTRFHIAKEQSPLLFAPGLWISRASMKFSSKNLSDVINALFVCASSPSKPFCNSELALSS